MIQSPLLCSILILLAVQTHAGASRAVHQERPSEGEGTNENDHSLFEPLEPIYNNIKPGEIPANVISQSDYVNTSGGDALQLSSHLSPAPPPTSQSSEETKEEETVETPGVYFPYAVALRRGPYGEHLCSGVLIGPQHVLTAAKCLDPRLGFTSSRPSIVIGGYLGHDVPALAQFEVMAVTSIAFHSQFGTHGQPDLAVLKLDRPSPQPPIGLATTGVIMPSQVSFLRWKLGSLADQLSQTVERVPGACKDHSECGATQGMTFCTAGKGPCPGDQGGPVFFHDSLQNKDLLVGIVGLNHGCEAPSGQAIHTDVLPHIPWIQAVLSGTLDLRISSSSPQNFRGSVLDGLAG